MATTHQVIQLLTAIIDHSAQRIVSGHPSYHLKRRNQALEFMLSIFEVPESMPTADYIARIGAICQGHNLKAYRAIINRHMFSIGAMESRRWNMILHRLDDLIDVWKMAE